MTRQPAQDITTAPRAACSPSPNALTGLQYPNVALTGQATAHLGDVNVYNQYYGNPTAQGSRSQPRPTIIIPFRRDVRDFVERDILKDLAERWSQPAACVAIVGLGGVGKTQIAIEHAYRCRDADLNMWIFWVHASSAERFQEGYKDIAATLQLTGWDNPQADILSMVQRWLSNEHNGRWTMVLDNADDSDVIFGLSDPKTDAQIATSSSSAPASSTNRSLSTYLPVSPNGSILITSRYRRVAEGLVDYHKDILELTAMTVEEAANLLSKKLGPDKNGTIEDDHICLVQELDCIPLAVSHAAAFILQRAPRMDVANYLQKLRSTDADRDRLLAVQGIRDARRDEKSTKSILTTWHISFEHIQIVQPSAARLLALMSLFDRQAIPEDLLVGRYSMASHSSWKPQSNQDSLQSTFEDDISTLEAYSLIKSAASDNLFTMHRLVQHSTQKWLELQDKLLDWQERFVQILINACPPDAGLKNWSRWQALWPHVRTATAYSLLDKDILTGWAQLLYSASRYGTHHGQLKVAEDMARKSLNIYENIYGLNPVCTSRIVRIVDLVTHTLCFEGDFAQAEKMARLALEGIRNNLGPNDHETVLIMATLAEILRKRGRHQQAEDLLREALKETAKLPVAELDVLILVGQLADVLTDQDKFDEAAELHRHAFSEFQKIYGNEHPTTLLSMTCISRVLYAQGRYKDAEEMLLQTLPLQEKVLGAHNGVTLRSVVYLAWVLYKKGDFADALPLFRRAASGFERMLGADHASVMNCKERLASCTEAIKDVELAERHGPIPSRPRDASHVLEVEQCLEND
ncbi:hypothetical protein LTR05_008027 [Lithohypha guttulata]|uniref:Kinesin light chain n=1 Tax=Lithohypha guttulata TaxID=1690604 RepID=A0AAN7STP2_9EURO|nr:hypothetical protein LTR05_008027 [Lithohypha guttulata]